jgi:hypothetical protein
MNYHRISDGGTKVWSKKTADILFTEFATKIPYFPKESLVVKQMSQLPRRL